LQSECGATADQPAAADDGDFHGKSISGPVGWVESRAESEGEAHHGIRMVGLVAKPPRPTLQNQIHALFFISAMTRSVIDFTSASRSPDAPLADSAFGSGSRTNACGCRTKFGSALVSTPSPQMSQFGLSKRGSV